jgi:hypothetical protein
LYHGRAGPCSGVFDAGPLGAVEGTALDPTDGRQASEVGRPDAVNDDVYLSVLQHTPTSPFPIYIMLLVARSFRFKRQVFRVGAKPEGCYRTLFRRSAARPTRSLRISAAGGGALTATLMLCWGYPLYADVPSESPKEPTPTPLSKLLSSYVVYSACSIPGLVEASPALLALCTSIPGLRQLTEAFVRATFFNQVGILRLYVDVIGVLISGNAVQSLLAVTQHTNAYR